MPFGKYRGRDLVDVPTSYLAWMVRECDNLTGRQRDAIKEELERRKGGADGHAGSGQGQARQPPSVDWSAAIRQWHREMVLRHHPDRGGSNEVMQILNDAVGRLKKLVGV